MQTKNIDQNQFFQALTVQYLNEQIITEKATYIRNQHKFPRKIEY